MKDTKEHILNVSFGLFLQKSFKEVTMKEIVEKTGMSKGAFYHYFDSKEQIFLEIISNAFSTALFVDFNAFSKSSLRAFYHSYIDNLNRTYAAFQNMAGSGASFDLNYYGLIFDAIRLFPDFREKMIQTNEAELEAWIGVIREAREREEIQSPMSDGQLARIFVHTNSGVGMDNIVTGRTEETPKALLALWDDFYAQIKR